MIIYFALLLVFVTGFTGLVYQVTWQKYLSNQLGSHALASTLVLAVFFGFLTLGYFTMSRMGRRYLSNQFRFYGILESLIGLYAILSPVYFEFLEMIFNHHIENPILRLSAEMLFACLFIGFPTWLMGGTLPALTEALSPNLFKSHRVHALIYSLNTFGAFLGAFVAGFYLIEILGLDGTLYWTGLVNVATGLLAMAVSGQVNYKQQQLGGKTNTNDLVPSVSKRQQRIFLLVSFLSGYYFFAFESLALRMAGLSLGSTTYTYSITVSAFIFAVGFGSYWVKTLKQTSQTMNFVLSIYSFMVLSLIILYFLIPAWPYIFLRIRVLFQPSLMNHLWYSIAIFVTFVAILVLPIGFLGMGLPLLFGQIRGSQTIISQTVGKLYGINSIGCVLGAIVGGYLFYYLGSAATNFKVNLIFVLLSWALLFWTKYPRQSVLALLLFLGFSFGVWFLPQWDESHFVPGAYLWSMAPAKTHDFESLKSQIRAQRKGQILFTKYDPNTTVHVFENESSGRGLYVNGKPDVSVVGDKVVRTLTALIPVSIAKQISDVFIIGLGSGRSAGLVAQFKENQSITVAEISNAVVEASRFFSEHNFNYQSLSKVQIKVGDAYKVLRDEAKYFDLIISEPSNPWVGGVEKLFSIEFLKMAKSHLRSGGLYAQWLTLGALSEDTFLTLLRTFNSVFPWTTVWTMGGAINILGSDVPLEIDFNLLQNRFNEQKIIYQEIGLHEFTSLLGLQILPPASVYLLVKDHPKIHSIKNPVLAFDAARAYFANVVTTLDLLLEQKMQLPIPDGFKSREFLVESYPLWKKSQEKIPESFYKDALNFAGYFKLARDRLNYFYTLNYPQKFSLEDRKKFALIQFLMGKPTTYTLPSKIKALHLQEFLSRYHQLKLMHLEPKIKILKEIALKAQSGCYDKACLKASNELRNLITKLENKKGK